MPFLFYSMRFIVDMLRQTSFLTLTLLLGISSIVSFAQTSDTPPAHSHAPRFFFKKGTTYDFGQIPEGPVAEHIFEFTNTGDEPLLIRNVSASCGCTTPIWPKYPILPGKKGKIAVQYNTAGRGNAAFDKQIYIHSNALTESENLVLHVKGYVTLGSGGERKE